MLNIVIPMAGLGSRFSQFGYHQPKPLIPVYGRPMIQVVVNNLRPSRDHRFIFICQRQHVEQHDLALLLHGLAPGSRVLTVEGVTAGAACTVLLAHDEIDNSMPLMIANCDQWICYPIDDYLQQFDRAACDGWLMTMRASSPKWSYVRRDVAGRVMAVVEKEVVSDEATVGIYNFRHGSDFVQAAKAMIEADERSKGEFYVAPVYSRLIAAGHEIGTCCIGSDSDGMYGLGTPEDLQRFLTLGLQDKLWSEAQRGRAAA